MLIKSKISLYLMIRRCIYSHSPESCWKRWAQVGASLGRRGHGQALAALGHRQQVDT